MPELALGIIAIVSASLYAREYYLRKHQTQQTLEKASHLDQDFDELTESVEKSQQFLTKAEQDLKTKLEEAIIEDAAQTERLLASKKDQFEKLEATFNEHLEALKIKGEDEYSQALKSFTSYLEELKKGSKNAEIANMQTAQTKINQLFENFETKLADFLLQTEQKMMLAVDLELRSARQLIDTYKVQQMNVVDENIVAMLEKTLALVLAKNLNLKDQMDLVYESLEKAKAEKFIV